MTNYEYLLALAESLIYSQNNTYCNDLQRAILVATLRGERKTYEQIADEYGYSGKYVKQDVAPKLWHLISKAVGQKITKFNVRAILLKEIGHYQNFVPSEIKDPNFDTITSLQSTNSISGSNFCLSEKAQANILLIDNEPESLGLLSNLLEEQGYNLQLAINGVVAIQTAVLTHPDLILLDIVLPDFDGYTVCQKLKANPKTQDIPIIFMSVLDRPWNKVKAFSIGGVDFITKPFQVIEVLARVENQLKIQLMQKELKAQNTRLQQVIQKLYKSGAIL